MAEFEGKLESEGLPKKIEKEIVQDSETIQAYKDLFKDDFEGMEKIEEKDSPSDMIDVQAIMKALFSDDYNEGCGISSKVNVECPTPLEAERKSAEISEKINIETPLKSKQPSTDVWEKVNIENTNSFNAEEKIVNFDETYEPNTKFEVNETIYETDDNGIIYKINGNELVPNTEYTIGGVTYTTDEQGRIVSCDGNATQTPEGTRDLKAQEQAGGEDRRDGDQGGHILARILGGAKGIENMLAMRGPINQGPYHTMEKEINEALQKGKDVHIHVDIKYDDDSKRPSKIIVTYTIDRKETVMEYDNESGSTDLLNSIEDKIEDKSYHDLKQEIIDANADGANISIIAVKTEYDEDGNVTKVTVVMRDENSGGPNEKRVLLAKENV